METHEIFQAVSKVLDTTLKLDAVGDHSEFGLIIHAQYQQVISACFEIQRQIIAEQSRRILELCKDWNVKPS
jgi:hypothetical protein